MFRVQNTKKLLLGVSALLLFSLPLQSYAVRCDYSSLLGYTVSSVQVDIQNSYAWVEVKSATNKSFMLRFYLNNNVQNSLLMNLSHSAFLFGSKVNVCYYSATPKELYALELIN